MTKIIHSVQDFIKWLEKRKFSSITVITSRSVASKLGRIINSLRKAARPKPEIIFLPDGEAAKEWRVVERLLSDLIKLNIDKRGALLAFGGGTVGDVVGFAASIYKRGIQYIQIPTTLLAQVDSAYGGKTGINFRGYKNQIGTTYNPVAVVADIKILKTLNNKQMVDGLGEIIKYGFIKDRSIINLLEKETILSLKNSRSLESAVRKSIKVKYFFTGKDPDDKGIRQILNFGHTIGHAIELKYKISHGSAVIAGMLAELSITEKLGITKKGTKQKLEKLLAKLGIETEKKIMPDWKAIARDKKIISDRIILPVVKRIGASYLATVRLSDFQKLCKKN